MMKKIVVLVSGNGSNLQTIIDACKTRITQGKIIAVFSNKANVYALERAKKAGADAHFLDPKLYPSRDAYDLALMEAVAHYEPDLVVLAGYMRMLNSEFVRCFLGKMINIHPSLLPKYPGLNTYQRAIHAGDEEHGTSVHFVTEQLDGGPVILQAKVPILETDTVESLTKRVQEQEYVIYPLVVQWFIEGRLAMVDGVAYFDDQPLGIHGYQD